MDWSGLMLLIIAIVIAIGFVTHVNVGLIAMAASYIVGCYFMEISPSAIQMMWPVRIFFILFSVSFFYNYANGNGTMHKLAEHLLYKYGKSAKLFPYLLLIVSFVMSAGGAGPYSIAALLFPFAFIICDAVGMSKLLSGLAVYYGSVAGGCLPISSTGATHRGIIESAGFPEIAFTTTIMNCVATTGFYLICLTILYFILGGHKIKVDNIKANKPAPYTREQRLSLYLILIFVLALLLPYVLGFAIKDSPFVTAIVKYNDVALIAIILSIVASLLKLGDEKKALASVPWNTIVMICGISIIVGVAVKAGTITMVSNWISGLTTPLLIPISMTLGAGIMSVFSSTTGVVLPTLYPMVASITGATGIAPMLLMVSTVVGSLATGMSPFSSMGGIMMSCAPEQETKYFYKWLLILPVAHILLAMTYVGIIAVVTG